MKTEEMPTAETVPANSFKKTKKVLASTPPPNGVNPIAANSHDSVRNECVTKNFLQTFKSIFLKYLISCFGAQVIKKYEILRKIKKSGMYKQEVLELFKEKDFKGAWEKMFAEKIHVSMLMKTRIAEQKKEDYLAVVHVLEKSF